MADITFDKSEKVNQIIQTSSRLNYLLNFTYRILPTHIISIRVDGDNMKIDVNTIDNMYRFKCLDIENVLLKDADSGVMRGVFDPALAQGILNIIDEFL